MGDQPLILVLPFVRPEGARLDVCLGDTLARTFRRRLEATGRRVVSVDAATHACRGLGIQLPSDRIAPGDLEWLLPQTGASHVIYGQFRRGNGELSLRLLVVDGQKLEEELQARGPEADFQEVIDDALVRAIQFVPGATGEHVRGALRSARTTESLDAYLAVVRARAAWAEGDEQGFDDEISAATRLDPGYVDPHEVVANAARASGDAEQMVAALQEVARVHREAGREHEQATALLSLGYALVENGEWDEGMTAYEEAAELFEAQSEVRGWVQARMNVANVHLRRGDHERAIEEYTRGLERVKGFPEDSAKHVFNLGLALKETGDLDGAVARLEEARQLGVELRDDELIASAYNALGTVMDDLGEQEKALHHFRRAEEHLDRQADPVLLAGVKDNIGIILKKQGDLERAVEYSEQACELLEARGDPHHVAIAYVNRAGLLLELGREEEAAPFVVAAHREFVRLGSPSRGMTERMLLELGFDEDSLDEIAAEASSDERPALGPLDDDDDEDYDDDAYDDVEDLEEDDLDDDDEDLDDEDSDEVEQLDELEIDDD